MHSTIGTALPSGDLDIEALLAFHRATFGAARMEGDSDSDDGSDGAESSDDADAGEDAADADEAEKDWKAEYEAQQRINKSLERKVKRDYDEVRKQARAEALAELRKAGKAKDDEPTADEIREQAKQEAKAEMLADRVADKIEAKAGARFSVKPERIAAMLLRENDVAEFITDGKVDAEAISDALDKLLAEEPHLAAQGGKRFKGTADGGTRKETPAKPTSLNDAIAARLSQSRTGT